MSERRNQGKDIAHSLRDLYATRPESPATRVGRGIAQVNVGRPDAPVTSLALGHFLQQRASTLKTQIPSVETIALAATQLQKKEEKTSGRAISRAIDHGAQKAKKVRQQRERAINDKIQNFTENAEKERQRLQAKAEEAVKRNNTHREYTSAIMQGFGQLRIVSDEAVALAISAAQFGIAQVFSQEIDMIIAEEAKKRESHDFYTK